jgi:excisionase family DNA binding protein
MKREGGRFYTPAEVAGLFCVDPKTVTRWAKAGKLSTVETIGGHRRYPVDEVNALLDGWSSVEEGQGAKAVTLATGSRHASVEALVQDVFEGDPIAAVKEIGEVFGLGVVCVDRAQFRHFLRRQGHTLTDDEWKRIASLLGAYSASLEQWCKRPIGNYMKKVVRAALVGPGASEGRSGSGPVR